MIHAKRPESSLRNAGLRRCRVQGVCRHTDSQEQWEKHREIQSSLQVTCTRAGNVQTTHSCSGGLGVLNSICCHDYHGLHSSPSPSPYPRSNTKVLLTKRTKIMVPCKNYEFHAHFAEKSLFQKNPHAHRKKIGTPPPPNPKYPPLKRGILWTWRFSCRKNAEILGAHQIGAAISGPRIADKNFTDTRIFPEDLKGTKPPHTIVARINTAEEGKPPPQIYPKSIRSSDIVFLNNFCQVSDSLHRETSRSLHNPFEKSSYTIVTKISTGRKNCFWELIW